MDLLERLLMKGSFETVTKGLPFIQAMRAFNRVVSTCFGATLSPDYKAAINEFKRVYWTLGISTTPKVMFIFLIFFFVTDLTRFTLFANTSLSFWKLLTARIMGQI